jgi:sugar-specific transcriptional regulator TrmB
MLGDVFGLSMPQTHAYRELVGAPSLDAEELAQRAGWEANDAYLTLCALEESGLASRQSTNSARFAAAPPQIALGALLARRSDELRLAQAELVGLEEAYRNASAGRRATDVVDVVLGADAVRQRLAQLQLGARERVDSFVKPPILVMHSDENEPSEAQAVARGVHYRVLADRAMIDSGDLTVEAAVAAIERGEEIRIAHHVPMKLMVIDRQLAILPIAEDPTTDERGESSGAGDPETVGALLIHRGSLLDGLLALFDAYWREATPLVTGDGRSSSELEPLDAQILSLLLAGLTDQATANQLGLSLRTVQRRVRALMDLAGADTRIQLGLHAARRAWV